MSITRRTALIGSGLATLGLAACTDAGGDDTITIGYMEAWTDTVAMAFLLRDRLEAMGYTVEFTVLADAALIYTALADGSLDIFSSAWPDVTHAQYMEQYGEDIEDLVTYNANATNMLAVPETTDITSIPELAADPSRFGGRIVGIEPGAGLTAAVQDSVMPAYGLDADFELVTSSTPAMLAELQNALDDGEDVVVTLWRPFWAFQEFPVKALEDPDLAFGEPETMHVLAHAGFSESFPDVAEFIGGIALSDEEYESLESTLVNDYEDGQEAEAVAAWIEAHPDLLPAVEES
ncbi:glycine betaine ABC transporter substrate-binding protein [Brachybacterium squillarum]|uniref:glycine betaine ABC transporter substrate-binding protein n=1 Tax=Brachybacterium squillarum TaxID=661979 RepID=UPI00026295D4|nr:glycine betaine ABC transporter substrate-binding protein [Brachybacterium squillarum]